MFFNNIHSEINYIYYYLVFINNLIFNPELFVFKSILHANNDQGCYEVFFI